MKVSQEITAGLVLTSLSVGLLLGVFSYQKFGIRGDAELLKRGIIEYDSVTGKKEWVKDFPDK